jgi:hypothetical protein
LRHIHFSRLGKPGHVAELRKEPREGVAKREYDQEHQPMMNLHLEYLRSRSPNVADDEKPHDREDDHKADDQEKVQQVKLASEGSFENCRHIVDELLHCTYPIL